MMIVMLFCGEGSWPWDNPFFLVLQIHSALESELLLMSIDGILSRGYLFLANFDLIMLLVSYWIVDDEP